MGDVTPAPNLLPGTPPDGSGSSLPQASERSPAIIR
jgi:hypothetical protein